MKRLLLIGAMICAIGFACSCNGISDGSKPEGSSAIRARSVDWEGLYLDPEGEHQQTLEVSVSRNELLFNYSIVSYEGNVYYSLSGRAILKVGDLEWDDDDHGVAYAVDEYVYDSACYMAIKIEADSHRRARIVTDDERVWNLVGENASTMMLVE
ncbi:MAG: hypothetical protein IJM33_05405 [Bacteroidales bacterium]|nr:hypothetical protein [Bacteroidales bacterium]MBR3411462.1 hypothetical protein [Bacteroidales bacterium]